MPLCNSVKGTGRARVLHGHAALLHGSSSPMTVRLKGSTRIQYMDRIHYIFVTSNLDVITRTLMANDLYCSPNIAGVIESRRMRWAGHVVRMVERRGVYRILVGKHEGKNPL